MHKLFLLTLMFSLFLSGEEYKVKKVAFIPYNNKNDSLPGINIPKPRISEKGDTNYFLPGESVRGWDIGLDRKIYLADGVKNKILVYDPKGNYIRSIGVWEEEKTTKIIKATSGREIEIHPYQLTWYNWKKNKEFSNPPTYFKSVTWVAADGLGNIYVPSGKQVMRFISEDESVEIIDKFGEYGREEIKDIGHIFSDAYGNIIIDVSLKKTYLFIKLNSEGRVSSINEKGWFPQDAKGRLYDNLPSTKRWNEPKSHISISVNYPDKVKQDTITIFFDPPTRSTFKGVDGEGNLYFSSGATILKYDQKGNLLARIYSGREIISKYSHKIPLAVMGTTSKIMKDGSIYSASLADQGVIFYKYEIKPGTKGQILKPAVKPEKN